MVDWDCLMEVLKYRGFGNHWITWVHGWLKSAKCHILPNADRTKEIVCRQGL